MEIDVKLDNLEKTSSECKRLMNKVNSIQSSFVSITRSLDWDIKSKANIQRYINNLSRMISDAKKTMSSHADFLNDAKESYAKAEEFNIVETEKLKNNLYNGNGKNLENGKIEGVGEEKKDDNYSILDFVKDFLISPVSEKDITKNFLKGKFKLSTIRKISGIAGLLGTGIDIFKLFDNYKSGKKCIGSLIADTAKVGIDTLDLGVNGLKSAGKFVIKHASSRAVKEAAFVGVKKLTPVANFLGSKLVVGAGVVLSSASTFFDSRNKYIAEYKNIPGRTEKDAIEDAAIDGVCTMAVEGVAAVLTFVAPPVGAVISVGLSAANSALGIDKGISTLIKTAKYEGFDGVKSLVANKVSDVANGISNAFNKVKNAAAEGCKSLLSNFVKVSFG